MNEALFPHYRFLFTAIVSHDVVASTEGDRRESSYCPGYGSKSDQYFVIETQSFFLTDNGGIELIPFDQLLIVESIEKDNYSVFYDLQTKKLISPQG